MAPSGTESEVSNCLSLPAMAFVKLVYRAWRRWQLKPSVTIYVYLAHTGKCIKVWTFTNAQHAGLPKLNDANNAGTKHSADCTLILTEGDSAMSLAVAGLAVIGRDSYGVFPLRSVLLDVHCQDSCSWGRLIIHCLAAKRAEIYATALNTSWPIHVPG